MSIVSSSALDRFRFQVLDADLHVGIEREDIFQSDGRAARLALLLKSPS